MLRRFAWGIVFPLVGACSLFTSLACGGGCSGGCEGSPKLKIFAGATSTTLEYLGLVTVDADAGVEPYTVFRKGTEAARIVFVCRGPSPSYIDPIVDAVTADCR